MALFFDQAWFDAKLAQRGLDRAVLAAVSGLSPDDLALVFKDQRELTLAEVAAFAELLGVSPAQIAEHAGRGTPQPRQEPGASPGAHTDPAVLSGRLDQIERRLLRIEQALGIGR